MGFCHEWIIQNALLNSSCFYIPRLNQKVFLQPKTVRTKQNKSNIRTVIAMRENGYDHQVMKFFPSYMTLYCLADKGCNRLQRSAYMAYKDAAESKSVGESTSGVKNTCVSIDGLGQRGGHTSLNSVVNAVDKCVDIEVPTKHCSGCRIWKRKKWTPEYQCWVVDHQGEINH